MGEKVKFVCVGEEQKIGENRINFVYVGGSEK